MTTKTFTPGDKVVATFTGHGFTAGLTYTITHATQRHTGYGSTWDYFVSRFGCYYSVVSSEQFELA